MPILALPPPPLQHSLCLGGVRRPGVVCTPHTQLKRAQPTPGGRPITERCGPIFLSMKHLCLQGIESGKAPPPKSNTPLIRTLSWWSRGVPWYPPPRIPSKCTSSAILVVQLIIDQGCAWATDQEYT
ncbi:unnamed protein product [Fusarium graminearum]|uniref:Uncharacterized protein n=1 Tax=Gibberella zeae TaxID=5518 RepID=A0A4E9DH29_GIBZA|nr:unnamed protein product [Fusarium graminearum]CAF3588810.1 unnamed protein product [Fusarium graminearum]CAG1964309.1 unnamed protein product [Fusarium graminearum]CAG1966414.1 unnamed protein product [Fusarium graminearum]